MTRGAQLIVSLTYSRSGLFGWHRAVMKRGGYTATLDGFHDAGLETTVPVALDDLADKLSGCSPRKRTARRARGTFDMT